ncbi:hypothetical protein EV644_13139 [Kribbella orskensis]|uniref:Uncharacterized protein n=1 Tax=Kribbella orskensis TaxID=2512216 RepID=A0ABY2B8D2_9ACTN|nr:MULTISPECIES: hypothetical protein [Kribbella]TCN30657.1 hypothetical protein EV642_13339 [Kribbella sp. VKM Ac-2500]TCO11376.1 hypothetical protein EV644_13139 [Kribbella orskensis]
MSSWVWPSSVRLSINSRSKSAAPWKIGSSPVLLGLLGARAEHLQHVPDGRREVALGQDPGRDLVEQQRGQMVVGAVDDG